MIPGEAGISVVGKARFKKGAASRIRISLVSGFGYASIGEEFF